MLVYVNYALNQHLYLKGMWLGGASGSKNKLHKETCSKDIGLRIQMLLTTLQSIVNTIEGEGEGGGTNVSI
jgi:hypothetical protein